MRCLVHPSQALAEVHCGEHIINVSLGGGEKNGDQITGSGSTKVSCTPSMPCPQQNEAGPVLFDQDVGVVVTRLKTLLFDS